MPNAEQWFDGEQSSAETKVGNPEQSPEPEQVPDPQQEETAVDGWDLYILNIRPFGQPYRPPRMRGLIGAGTGISMTWQKPRLTHRRCGAAGGLLTLRLKPRERASARLAMDTNGRVRMTKGTPALLRRSKFKQTRMSSRV